MQQKSLRELAERIEKGVASEEEIRLFDRFIYHSQSEEELADDQLGKKLWQSIEKENEEKKTVSISWGAIWRVAAMLVLVATLAFLASDYFEPSISQIQTLSKSTSNTQIGNIQLADGSSITMNSGTLISYAENFTSLNERRVNLKGEAFFDVTRDTSKAFVVEAGEYLIKVLGTSFNIRNYKKDEFEVTVATGRVEVMNSNDTSNAFILSPGDQLLYGTKGLLKREVNPAEVLAWRSRKLKFEELAFQEALKQIERIYNIQVLIDQRSSNHCLVTGSFENETLNEVMDALQLVTNFDYQIQGDSLMTIKGKGCSE